MLLKLNKTIRINNTLSDNKHIYKYITHITQVVLSFKELF